MSKGTPEFPALCNSRIVRLPWRIGVELCGRNVCLACQGALGSIGTTKGRKKVDYLEDQKQYEGININLNSYM
jgi:hypothetical protein